MGFVKDKMNVDLKAAIASLIILAAVPVSFAIAVCWSAIELLDSRARRYKRYRIERNRCVL